ncbi:MAG: hypothetical protein AAFV53_43310 [Myxococcota bacterium]
MKMMMFLWMTLVACLGGDVTDEIQGRWAVDPSADDLRRAQVMQLAFKAPPPTDAEIIQAKLSPEENNLVRSIRTAREDNPGAPELKQMQARMQAVSSATLTITATELTFEIGGQAIARTYTVLTSGEESVQVRTVSPRGEAQVDTLTLLDEETLQIKEADGDVTTLRRILVQ